MTAYIQNINTEYDILHIVRLAGVVPTSSPFDEPMHWLDGDTLYVNASSQKVLTDALATYEASYVAPTPLSQERTQAKSEIDYAAGQTRAKYITTSDGQAEVYLMKATDAEAFIAAGYPGNPTRYPFVEAEALATGKTLAQSADGIIAKRNAWKILGAAIEKERLLGKANVDNASTEGTITNAKDLAISKLGDL